MQYFWLWYYTATNNGQWHMTFAKDENEAKLRTLAEVQGIEGITHVTTDDPNKHNGEI